MSREPLNGFATNSDGRRVWSFARTSLKVNVNFAGLRAVYVWKTIFAVVHLWLSSLVSTVYWALCRKARVLRVADIQRVLRQRRPGADHRQRSLRTHEDRRMHHEQLRAHRLRDRRHGRPPAHLFRSSTLRHRRHLATRQTLVSQRLQVIPRSRVPLPRR